MAGDLDRMDAALNVYNAVSSWHSMFHGSGGKDTTRSWLASNKTAWRIVQEWMKLCRGEDA